MISDIELVDRCLAGDPTGPRDLVRQFEGPVLRLCLRMLGQREDAEDVAQESLMRTCRHLESWDRSRPLLPWILAITANRCRTALQRRARRPSPSPLYFDAVQAAAAADDLGEELERALQDLREEYRSCFVLFHEQELSVMEIGEVLDVPEGTVKTWLHRARRQLADRLKSRGFS